MTGRGGWRADVGRRGAGLLILAAGDVAYGTALLAGYAPLTVATDLAPAATWGTAWIIIAILLTAGAFSPADQLAYALSALAKFSWAALIFADQGEHHTRGGWGPAVPWLTLAGLVILMSGWPEPADRP